MEGAGQKSLTTRLIFWDIKQQIFGSKRSQKFYKMKVLRDELAFFHFMGKSGKILINKVILD